MANSGSGSVSVIDPTTSAVKKEITVGGAPVYIFGAPSLDTIYVANSGSGTVSVIDTTTDAVIPNLFSWGFSSAYIW